MANPVQINDALHTDAWVVGGTLTGVVSAQDARTSLASFVAHDGAGPRLGVFYEGTQALITGTATTSPSMQVSVAPLAFAGQKAAAEGVYVGRSVGTVLVDIAAAPGANSRIDTVYVMQRDLNSTTSPDGLTQGEIGVVTGTAGASPTAPAAPAGAVVIGTVQVAAGVTATTNAGCTITTTARWTCSSGSAIPVRNSTERGSLTAFDGLRVYRIDNGVVESSYGGVWRQAQPFAQARGTLAVTTTVGSPNVANTITLPAIFTVPPIVLVTWSSGSGEVPGLRTFTVTSSSFGVNVVSDVTGPGVSGNLHWEAIQTTSTTA